MAPGYVDHHVHLLSSVAARLSIDVSPATTVGEVVAIIAADAAGAARPGWRRAWGYDEALLVEGRHPDRDDLDRAAPDAPVVLHHRSGHAAVLNSAALAEIGRPDHGTGILVDRHDLLARVPRLPGPDMAAAAQVLSAEWAASGVAAFVDATHTNGPAELELISSWCAGGIISQDVTAMVSLNAVTALPGYGRRVGAVRVGPVKLMPPTAAGDGPVGGPGEELHRAVGAAHAAGYPAAVHCVDIATLDAVLYAFEMSRPPDGTADRVEHNAVCLPEQVERLAATGAGVVVNPSFLRHRAVKYRRQLTPVEWPWLIRIRSLVAAGVDVRAGSDSPVTPSRPAEMIAAATGHPFSPVESVDRWTAEGLLRP